MARIKRKGTSGAARNYITRTQAVRKLQVSLQDFRRLCIFKGIYPREPRNKKKASKSSTPSTTFYYTKDIQYILHEPVLQQLRDQKAFEKKLSRYIGRGDYAEAARLEKFRRPQIRLDHIVRERYPTFVDALRDLDDPLCMLFLFANLPSTPAVPAKTSAKCERLCLEFQNYVIATNSLRKSFLSIKGIYYQATIQGQDIMWLVPYKFTPRMTNDIDFRIMGTFVEFYTILVGYVNYRLYTSIGLVYPPKFNAESDAHGGELQSMTLQGRDDMGAKKLTNGNQDAKMLDMARADSIAERATNLPSTSDLQPNEAEKEADQVLAGGENDEEAPSTSIDKFEQPTDPEADQLPQPQYTDSDAPSKLFEPFTFYLSRETPRQPLEFLLRAFGCKRIGWDPILGDGAFTTDENNPAITHQVVDRPVQAPQDVSQIEAGSSDDAADARGSDPLHKLSRTYVQPQWVWDCINACALMRPDLYAPGAELPPHLSPWVKPGKGQYDPTLPLGEQEKEDEAAVAALEDAEEKEAARSDEDESVSSNEEDFEDDEEEDEDEDISSVDLENGMQVAADDSDEASDSEEETDQEAWLGFGSDGEKGSDGSEADEEATLQRELEAEAAGLSVSGGGRAGKSTREKTKGKPDDIRKELAKKKKAEDEELERKLMMMSRKKRKLFEKMVYSNKEKESEAEALRAKRRKLERKKGGRA